MQAASQTAESAKQFLLRKVVEQAQRNNVKLSDVERRMFLFSETSGHADFEANEKFDAEYESEEYERKIASLLKKAYQRDSKDAFEKEAWNNALSALRNEDFYGLVMVDTAGIPRPNEMSQAISEATRLLFDKRLIGFLLTVAAVIGIAVLLIFDPLHSNWIRPGWPRLVLIPIFLAILWWIGDLHRRSLIGRPPTR